MEEHYILFKVHSFELTTISILMLLTLFFVVLLWNVKKTEEIIEKVNLLIPVDKL